MAPQRQSKVFSVTASGAIPPSWVLEGSSDLRNWGMLANGCNSAVNVTVVVTPQASLFFRLNSPLPGVRLQTQQLPGAFPDSFCCSATGAVLPAWTLQASADLRVWKDLASATGADLKVAIVSAWRASLFFRLRSRQRNKGLDELPGERIRARRQIHFSLYLFPGSDWLLQIRVIKTSTLPSS